MQDTALADSGKLHQMLRGVVVSAGGRQAYKGADGGQ